MNIVLIIAVICAAVLSGQIQPVRVSGSVSVVVQGGKSKSAGNANAVVWLSAKGTQAALSTSATRHRYQIRQHDKRFDPHVLAVPVNSSVAFPNFDPFLHNVFSMFDGKRFDLGLYEAGASQNVTFDRPGICYIFCNIHPEMSAIVIVLDTPYYALSDAAGQFTIDGVPAGRYSMHVWHERGKPETATEFPREVTITAPHAELPRIRLIDAGQLVAPHKNKYGRDYDTPAAAGTLYK